jgi:hypothetical protein
MRILIVSFAACLLELSNVTLAQPLSFGVIGGASLTQDFQNRSFGPAGETTTYGSTPLRWIVGGMVEVRLPTWPTLQTKHARRDLELPEMGVDS